MASNDPGLRLEINKLRLDEEWVGQAVQYYWWAKKVADAQLAYDAAKSKMSLADAELNRDIRNDPTAYNVGKVSNDTVDAAVLASPEHIAAQNKINEAYHELLCTKAAVDALEHRKRALSMLVELYTREYYADSHARGARDMTDEEKGAVRGRGQRRSEIREEDREM